MSNLNRLPTTCRVYLKRGPVVHLSNEDAFAFAERSLLDGEPIRGVTTDGERMLIPASCVLDVVEPNPAARVKVEPAIFSGRLCLITSLAGARQSGHIDSFEAWDFPDESIVVYGEDMAGTVVLVADATAERVLWDNPANEDGVSKRYLRAARALVEAESLQAQAYAEAPLRQEDEVNALAFLEKGDVQAAIDVAGAEYVAAFLQGKPADMLAATSFRPQDA